MHEAAAVITFLSPGLRFFHQGQFEGRRARISPHLVRAPIERTDETLRGFYDRLLCVLRRDTPREGSWRLLECAAAWKGNETWDGFLAFAWEGRQGEQLLAAVNYAGTQGQCYVKLPFSNLANRPVHLRDLMRPASYDRDGNDILSRGLYLDLPAWGYHVFEITSSRC